MFQEVTEGIRRSQKFPEVSICLRRFLEVIGGLRRSQEVSRGLRRFLKVSWGLRWSQEVSIAFKKLLWYWILNRGLNVPQLTPLSFLLLSKDDFASFWLHWKVLKRSQMKIDMIRKVFKIGNVLSAFFFSSFLSFYSSVD